LGNRTSGWWWILFRVYIPQGKVGYFNTLAVFDGINSDWAMHCFFDVGGVGRLIINATEITFNYSNEIWHSVELFVDLDNDIAKFSFNQQLIHTWPWTQWGTITNQLAANDFYGATTNSEMYIDDYIIYNGCLSCQPPNSPSNLITQIIADPYPRVYLQWQDNSYDENAFKILRKNGYPSDPSSFQWIGAVKNNVVEFVDSLVFKDSTYTYGVIAYNVYGDSDTSDLATITIDSVTSVCSSKNHKTFFLSQNYPNPFNPTTRIQYAVISRQLVSLKIYDVLSDELATLVNEEKPAGTYEVEFNATGLPSGVYFYQLRAGSYIETKKMIILK